MIRIYIKEVATLVSLALFAGIIIHWANIIELLVIAHRAAQ